MRDAPVIRTAHVPGRAYGYKVNGVMKVRAGLNYLRGNAAPYFSLTAEVHRKGFPDQWWAGGAMHDEIVRRFPSLRRLAEMHLSDVDGTPMHAEANGLYWLAGWLGGLGQRYHGGADKTPEECREIALRHFRCTAEALESLASEIDEAWHVVTPVYVEDCEPPIPTRDAHIRQIVRRFVEAQRPRWKAEAEAAIQEFGLEVFGDPWNPEG